MYNNVYVYYAHLLFIYLLVTVTLYINYLVNKLIMNENALEKIIKHLISSLCSLCRGNCMQIIRVTQKCSIRILQLSHLVKMILNIINEN